MEDYLADICFFMVGAAAVYFAAVSVYVLAKCCSESALRLRITSVWRMSPATLSVLSAFALVLLPTVAKRTGTMGSGLPAQTSAIAARSDETSLRGSGALAASAPWFTDISPTPTSVWLGVAWDSTAFVTEPFVEFYARTNLCAGAWESIGWAEAVAGETNISVEVEAARLPGGAMPQSAFFKAVADDGLGDDDEDYDCDGISNGDERLLGTNPRRADTDGDGFDDGVEAARVSYGAALPAFDLSSLSNVLSGTLPYQPVPASFAVDIPFDVQFVANRSRRAIVHFEGMVAFVGEGASDPTVYSAINDPADLYGTGQAAVAAYGCLFWMMGGGLGGPQLRAGIVQGTQGRWFVAEWRDVMHPNDYAYLTLERSTFLLAVSEAEPGTVYVRYETLAGSIDGSTGIVGAHGFGGVPDLLVGDCVLGSVTNGMTLAYHFGTGTDPLVADTDGDGLPDGWEAAHGMDPLVSNWTDGDPRTNADADPDCDGLTNAQEAALGTDPFQPDTDGDGMDDGWESRHGFDPAAHNGQTERTDDNANADPDGDGLTNAEECAWETNPSNADSDGDGVNDGTEIAQNSDPADATDGGLPNSRISVKFLFGDHSESHSEKYSLHLRVVSGSGYGNTPRSYIRTNRQYGECETNAFLIAPGWLYEVELAHSGTLLSGSPDYDYTLVALPQTPVQFLNTNGFFGVINASSSFPAAGKIANMYAVEQVIKTNSVVVAESAYLYITPEPSMPSVSARLYPTGLVGTANMRLKIEYLRSPASQTTFYPNTTSWKTIPADGEWHIVDDIGFDFRGGRASLSGTYGGYSYTNTFHVRGINPTDVSVENAIGDELWYLKAIARRESGQQNGHNYCQFNELGDLGTAWGDYRACPNFGGPNGWGIFMLDPPPTEETLWNWRTNVCQGVRHVYDVCIPAATQWINRQIAQQEAEEPDMPLAAQTFVIGGVAFRAGSDKTPIDACAIQRYNGASRWVIYWRNKTPTRAGAWCVRQTATTYVANVMEYVNE